MKRLRSLARDFRDSRRLPERAKAEARVDRAGLPEADAGPVSTVKAHLAWLERAQDSSASGDGGVARHFSLVDGWSASYPETTGYIIPTLLECARRFDQPSLEERARRMLDWLVGIQFEEGGFQGGVIGQEPVVPVTFNTGQILLGLAAGTEHFGESVYADSMARAAEWLTRTQDSDGAWRSAPTPFSRPGEKAYETHVAWGLLEAARVAGESRWLDAGLANIDWALSFQRDNGWFASCCLTDPERPLTHTLGYALRGVVAGYRHSGRSQYLAASRRTARALLSVQRADGSLPGRLDRDWRSAAEWSCLTGNVQIAASWLLIAGEGGPEADAFVEAARRANRMVRRTTRLEASPGIAGGVKGSFPVDGRYGRFQMLNWAAKFAIDSNLLEADLDPAAV